MLGDLHSLQEVLQEVVCFAVLLLAVVALSAEFLKDVHSEDLWP